MQRPYQPLPAVYERRPTQIPGAKDDQLRAHYLEKVTPLTRVCCCSRVGASAEGFPEVMLLPAADADADTGPPGECSWGRDECRGVRLGVGDAGRDA